MEMSQVDRPRFPKPGRQERLPPLGKSAREDTVVIAKVRRPDPVAAAFHSSREGRGADHARDDPAKRRRVRAMAVVRSFGNALIEHEPVAVGTIRPVHGQ